MATIIHDVRTQQVCDAGQSWRRLGRVHMDKSECVQMHAMTCWGESASWKCMGMAQRVLGGTVAMQVGTRHHYKSRKNPWKWGGVGTGYDSIHYHMLFYWYVVYTSSTCTVP